MFNRFPSPYCILKQNVKGLIRIEILPINLKLDHKAFYSHQKSVQMFFTYQNFTYQKCNKTPIHNTPHMSLLWSLLFESSQTGRCPSPVTSAKKESRRLGALAQRETAQGKYAFKTYLLLGIEKSHPTKQLNKKLKIWGWRGGLAVCFNREHRFNSKQPWLSASPILEDLTLF